MPKEITTPPLICWRCHEDKAIQDGLCVICYTSVNSFWPKHKQKKVKLIGNCALGFGNIGGFSVEEKPKGYGTKEGCLIETQYFGTASTTDDWIKHKRIVGELELKRKLMSGSVCILCGMFLGFWLGLLSQML